MMCLYFSLDLYFQIINVFSVDSYRVFLATWTGPFLLSLPVFLIISTVYSYILIGYWCFVAIVTFIICYIAQVKYEEKTKQLILSFIYNLCYIKIYHTILVNY